MISTSCVGLVPSKEGRLVDLPGVHHCHLVGDQGWQQVGVWHRDRVNSTSFFTRKFLPRLTLMLGLELLAWRDYVGGLCG